MERPRFLNTVRAAAALPAGIVSAVKSRAARILCAGAALGMLASCGGDERKPTYENEQLFPYHPFDYIDYDADSVSMLRWEADVPLSGHVNFFLEVPEDGTNYSFFLNEGDFSVRFTAYDSASPASDGEVLVVIDEHPAGYYFCPSDSRGECHNIILQHSYDENAVPGGVDISDVEPVE